MNAKKVCPFFVLSLIALHHTAQADTILYTQDFEHPVGFVNDAADINIYRQVNALYGNQPTGFTFAQAYSVETLLITGTKAFGHGYADPSGVGGHYALGMLSTANNDLLGLNFNVGSYKYLNLKLDISSIDLSAFGGPFVKPGDIPKFKVTLYDNPSGATTTGAGTVLDTVQFEGLASARDEFKWTDIVVPLITHGNTNGNVTLQIDLLNGGYAALDNFKVSTSDIPATVPLPASIWLLGSSLLGMIGISRKRA